jgi:hypothetical protein
MSLIFYDILSYCQNIFKFDTGTLHITVVVKISMVPHTLPQ